MVEPTDDERARFAAARQQWPDVELAASVFAAALRRHSECGEHVGDLYLATACAHGVETATRAFDRAFGSLVLKQAARLDAGDCSPEEFKQRVWSRLMLAAADRPPKLAEYSGTGPLKAWLAIVVSRMIVDAQRESSGRKPAPALEGLPTDLELDYLKRHYEGEFEAALTAAAAELSVRERNVLAHTIVDGLEQAEVAAIYGVHPSTASRWIAQARESLLRNTRRALMDKLGVGRKEVESILRLIHSRMDVTLGPLLRPVEGEKSS